MLCRSCLETESRGRPKEERPAKRDQLCSRCGKLLGPRTTATRVQRKHSQLERFGLTGTDGALLKGKPRRERRERKDRRD